MEDIIKNIESYRCGVFEKTCKVSNGHSHGVKEPIKSVHINQFLPVE